MPALFMFLFKVNIALLLFCMGYYLVLRHLTFYTHNRIYLVAAILFSSVYPWINISGFMQRHQQLTAPVQSVILQWRAPAENLVKPLNQPNYWLWAEWIFWAGAILFALRLVIQLLSLYRLYRDSEPGHMHNYPVRLIRGDVSPFSFWRSIYVNPSKLSASDLEKVLEHEQVHVNEWHTLDILLAELSTVFYWFNPGIWLMKKAVKENIEFITDRKILQKGVDSKQYQYSLLNVSMAGSANKLVNNFNISTIKKRIVMMNAKRSSRLNLGRYIFVAPAVIILLLVFSISKADVAKRTLRNITLSLRNVTISNNETPKPVATAIKKRVVKTITKNVSADTIYKGKSKDGKHNMMLTSDNSVDSVLFVLNGAKSSNEEVKAIDPGQIMSLDMLPADRAKRYVDFTIEKPEVLFVTTRDSETGKKLKARFDKDMGGGTLAGAKKITLDGRGDVASTPPSSSSNLAYATTITSSDARPSNNTAVNVYGIQSSDATPEAAVAEGNAKNIVRSKNMVYVKAMPKIALKNSTKVTTGDMIYISPKADELVTVDSNGVEHTNYITKSPKAGVLYTIKAGTKDSDQPIFVVDGKITKSIKSVDSKDIKSVTVLTDKGATKKYGEKGKNGVIVITTKKASE